MNPYELKELIGMDDCDDADWCEECDAPDSWCECKEPEPDRKEDDRDQLTGDMFK